MSNMSNPSKCERDGFAARSSGQDRATNPYDLILGPDARPRLAKMQRDMPAAWWKGWDKAPPGVVGLSVVRWPKTRSAASGPGHAMKAQSNDFAGTDLWLPSGYPRPGRHRQLQYWPVVGSAFAALIVIACSMFW